MALRGFGSIGKVRMLPETFTLKRKRQGLTLGEGTFEIYCSASPTPSTLAKATLNFPGIGSRHPYTSADVFMEEQELTFGPCGVRARCVYAGVSDEDLDSPVYDLVIGMEDQPIETHPDFQATIGGKPSHPLNGALFVDDGNKLTGNDFVGTFAGFTIMVQTGPTTYVNNPFAGIESYLDASAITWRESYVSRTLPSDDYHLGLVYDNVPGPAIAFPGRNWLYMGYQMRERGLRFKTGGVITTQRTVFEITREWRLSGRRGWNTTIYCLPTL
jgi:hypothetical protein